MISFLTSSFVEYQAVTKYKPMPLYEDFGFGDNLRKYWKKDTHFLIFSSNPADYKMTDHVVDEIGTAFRLAAFSIAEIRYFDNRVINQYASENGMDIEEASREALKEALKWADVLYMSGGHAPTQNAFMKRCGLKELLSASEYFDGIFIGLSAGSINASSEVYLIPELEGEAVDSSFVRFTEGLGLTSIKMLPHYQYFKDVVLDDLNVVDDIVTRDSFGREIYLINDKSYFMIHNGVTEFFGEGDIISDGVKRPLKPGIILEDTDIKESIAPFIENSCDLLFSYDSNKASMTFFYVSEFFLDNGVLPVNMRSLSELNGLLSRELIVKEEKQVYLYQADMSLIEREILKAGAFVRTMHIDTVDGIRTETLRVAPIPGKPGNYLWSFLNVSSVVDHDWMTDVYSREGFIKKLYEVLKSVNLEDGYSALYFNIQGFKAVNALLGIHSGDMVIFHERDVLDIAFDPILYARLEDDHFIMVVEDDKLVPEVLDSICHQVYEEENKLFPFTIRCGIYPLKDAEESAQVIIDRAKLTEETISDNRGKPYAFFNDKLREEYVTTQLLVSELDDAIARSEFVPYYQPVVDIKTHEIVSAEALVRWVHHERGMISPGVFIPAFENKGLTSKIDNVMLEKVLDFNHKRIKEHKKVVPCAVNLSRVDFYDITLLDTIRAKASASAKMHEILKLEVTESAYEVLENNAMDFLKEMKRLGIALLLDDFGSGMSSFSSLEGFEFDIIKLDMGFVRRIGKSFKSEAIIKSVISLAHAIGAQVVAEGVETKEQLDFLSDSGCDMIQGYYFYKPMSQAEFEKLLDSK